MNGRIYDADLGRFMQADPFIQDAAEFQNYNRYSYVQNNPLSLTDPSGYFSLSRAWKKIKKAVKIVVAAVAAYYAFTYVLNALGTTSTAGFSLGGASTFSVTTYGAGAYIGAGAAAGFVGGAIMTGSLRGALQGAASGAIFGGIQGIYGNAWTWGRVGSTSVAGGVTAEIAGGKFRDGFRVSLAVSLLTFANYKMRLNQIRNSSQNPDNINGKSAGFFGDGKKLAGARHTIDPKDPNSYIKCESLMGGCQGAPISKYGDVRSSFLGASYEPSSIQDYVNESFAGPHDWFRDATGSYLSNGNSISTSGFSAFWDEIKNYTLVIPAAPFAVGGIIGSTQTLHSSYLIERYEER